MASSATSVNLLTGNQDLRRDVDIWPLCFSCYFYAVAHRGSSCESPARAAVLGEELVSLNGEVVGSIDISPPERFREIFFGDFFDRILDMGFVI